MNVLRRAVLTRANRKADKSVSITFVTDTEQSTEEFMEIDKMVSMGGIMYFKSGTELTKEEVDAINEVNIKPVGKTKSQRLRGALNWLFKTKARDISFQQFYDSKMEMFISEVKSEAEDNEM